MNTFNIIWAFVASLIATKLWLYNKKKSNRKDIMFVSIATITAFVMPIFFLIHAYRMPELNFWYWLCIIVSIVFILAYLINFVILFILKKQIDKDFKNVKMFDKD